MHEVWLQQGISTDVINVANPQAMQFARDVIDELIDLFPFRYIHLAVMNVLLINGRKTKSVSPY